MTSPRTDTVTLIAALRVLAREVESGDGVANAAIAEAADRLEELHPQADAMVDNGLVLRALHAGKIRRESRGEVQCFLFNTPPASLRSGFLFRFHGREGMPSLMVLCDDDTRADLREIVGED